MGDGNVLTNIAFALDVAMLIVAVIATKFLLRMLIFSTLEPFDAAVPLRAAHQRISVWWAFWLPSINLSERHEASVKDGGSSSRNSNKCADQASNHHNDRNASGEDSDVCFG